MVTKWLFQLLEKKWNSILVESKYPVFWRETEVEPLQEWLLVLYGPSQKRISQWNMVWSCHNEIWYEVVYFTEENISKVIWTFTEENIRRVIWTFTEENINGVIQTIQLLIFICTHIFLRKSFSSEHFYLWRYLQCIIHPILSLLCTLQRIDFSCLLYLCLSSILWCDVVSCDIYIF